MQSRFRGPERADGRNDRRPSVSRSSPPGAVSCRRGARVGPLRTKAQKRSLSPRARDGPMDVDASPNSGRDGTDRARHNRRRSRITKGSGHQDTPFPRSTRSIGRVAGLVGVASVRSFPSRRHHGMFSEPSTAFHALTTWRRPRVPPVARRARLVRLKKRFLEVCREYARCIPTPRTRSRAWPHVVPGTPVVSGRSR